MKRARGFGRLAQFEGTFQPETRTLLVDDLTTDGRTKDSIKRALIAAQAKVIGVFVLLDYKVFPIADDVTSLMCLADIAAAARDGGGLGADELEVIEDFLSDAPRWSRRNGGIDSI